jgi:hypothetical protein
MVNTFITSINIRQSGESLDLVRLNKQVVEGYQIQRVIDQLYHIAELEGVQMHPEVKCIESYRQAISWVKEVSKSYLSKSYRYIVKYTKDEVEIRGTPVVFRHDKHHLPVRIYKKDKYQLVDKVNETTGPYVVLWLSKPHELGVPAIGYKSTKTKEPYLFHQSSVVLPHEELYKLGYINHPATLMWIGYLPFLRNYIYIHSMVYEEKTGTRINILVTFQEEETSPWWLTERFMVCHKASLNKKDSFYNFDLNGHEDKGYIWPSSLSLDECHGLCS